MLYVALKGHDWTYNIEDIVRLFLGWDKPIYINELMNELMNEGLFLDSEVSETQEGYFVANTLYKDGVVFSKLNGTVINENELETIRRARQELKRQLYILLSKYFNKELPWGTFTGIRPAKIVREMMDLDMDELSIKEKLRNYYLISDRKTQLAYEVAKNELPILIKTSGPKKVGLYIGIPFCPTRCLYCSFTSNPIDKYHDKVKLYIEALKRELTATWELISSKGWQVQSVYMGGGTPTSISHEELDMILNHLCTTYDLSSMEEFTVEAGRPDSITPEKLEVIKKYPVDRISINPQTMNDKTLELIGRKHTAADVKNAFYMAREHGFTNINMDIIIGLPEEKLSDFEYTLSEIEKMSPENLTVHSLAVKRASRLKENLDEYDLKIKDAELMTDASYLSAKKMGMEPYYLYRQKNMVGNLENTGYCKKGLENNYNIQMMEETQTIFAVGAGAITKAIFQPENRIERAGNVKNVDDYINRIDEMIQRKIDLFSTNLRLKG